MSTEPLPPARKQRPRVNDAAVDAAIEAIRGGATLEQAAASIGMSGNSLARRLYKRGTSVLALRPPVPAPHPERTRTYGECYYCHQPLRQRHWSAAVAALRPADAGRWRNTARQSRSPGTAGPARARPRRSSRCPRNNRAPAHRGGCWR